ncbi:C40 family peptidase [Dysosmobacter sp.]|uniref:C40 family peptidase n=1 Tax=Dysosmobacter sp. TaxID=2591382 RepID=UPI003AB782DD
MGQPKSKRTAMLDPCHRAMVLKEKYRQQLAERQEPESDSAETQAVDEVEDTANWAVDTVQDRAAQVPRVRQKPPIKEKSSASIPREHKANEQTAASREPPARYTAPKSKNFLETPSAEEARPLDEKQQFEARCQFVADKQKSKLLSEQRTVHSVEEPPAFYDAEWEPVSPSKTDTPKHSAFKEKKRFAVNDHSRSKPEKSLPAPKVKRTSFKTAAKPILAAQKTASQQQIHQTAAQAKKTAKTAVELFKRAAGMLRRAAAALISALAGLVGGSVVLVALVVIIIIAAVASSPFGLYFAAERNAPNTVSVAEAVAQVNIAYNTKLEELQTGDYDSIDIQGQAPDWPNVLAVFAAKTAGTDDGVDVATLDADRVARLTAVFWDMTKITSWVETINHPGSGDDDGWTEYILHITITPKTADEMRTIYSFTRYQNEALDELLADRTTLASLASSLTITNADAVQVLQSLPADLSQERKAVVQNALTLYGKVSYFWGGKSLVIGWDSRWGELRQVTAAGSSATGTYRPYGLDCSGLVDWAFYNATGGSYIIGHGGGATMQHAYCADISWSDAQPGDLVFYPDNSHVGIICGRDEDGSLLVIHCASGANNVVITGTSGFISVARPDYFSDN